MSIRDQYKTQGMCNKAFEESPYTLVRVSDRFNSRDVY